MLCKYYSPHLETIKQYIICLYQLEGCGSGGLLHILLDDDSLDDDSITFCLKGCLLHPEKEEAELGKLICAEYLKLSIEQRRLLSSAYTDEPICVHKNCIEDCIIRKGWGSD